MIENRRIMVTAYLSSWIAGRILVAFLHPVRLIVKGVEKGERILAEAGQDLRSRARRRGSLTTFGLFERSTWEPQRRRMIKGEEAHWDSSPNVSRVDLPASAQAYPDDASVL